MNLGLAEIIQTGGPVGFALLFAWLWIRSEAALKDERKEHRDLMHKLIRKAGFDA